MIFFSFVPWLIWRMFIRCHKKHMKEKTSWKSRMKQNLCFDKKIFMSQTLLSDSATFFLSNSWLNKKENSFNLESQGFTLYKKNIFEVKFSFYYVQNQIIIWRRNFRELKSWREKNFLSFLFFFFLIFCGNIKNIII